MREWISQEEAAEKIGVKFYRYANWEQGRAVPPLNLLESIAKTFHVSADELLGIEPQNEGEELLRLYNQMPNDVKNIAKQ